MIPFKGMLRGKRGLKWLERAGSYAVVANRKLLRRGQASKYAVTNPQQRLVTSVHDTEDEAVMVAEALSNNEAGKRPSSAT